MKRRDFLKFLGASGLTIAALPNLTSCLFSQKIVGIKPSNVDDVILAKGLDYKLLVRWGDLIGQNLTFGYDNDFIAFFPLKENRALLWINHEEADPLFVSDFTDGHKNRLQVDLEMDNIGGSIIEIARMPSSGTWTIVPRSNFNRRFTAKTEIPFAWPLPIAGKTFGVGTLANCAGGKTPWGHVLTCEENYHNYFGEIDFKTGVRTNGKRQWEIFYQNPTEHYGWVVEINPQTGDAKKLIALGRFSHEGATVVETPDKRCVVYMGDDKEDEYLYKFIADRPGTLETGSLYVAHIESGKWMSLQLKHSPLLQEHFKNQTEIQIHTRLAAKLLGATPLDRPEDIKLNPNNNEILIALTGGSKINHLHGSLLSLAEKDNNPLSLEFSTKTFLTGGHATGFSSPDNLLFDRQGHLWFTSDIGYKKMKTPEYAPFLNNGLFYVPMHGPQYGQAIQMASAPIGAEFTGPCFSDDGKTLFLSVQHPGQGSKTRENPVSHWPDGGGMPAPSVIQISGDMLN